MLSFQAAVQAELDASFAIAISFVKAAVSKTSKQHMLLQTATFRGDSGAAIVLADGKLVGMSIAGINAAKERIRCLVEVETTEAGNSNAELRLLAIEKSVDSLVGNLAQGSMAVLAGAFVHYCLT